MILLEIAIGVLILSNCLWVALFIRQYLEVRLLKVMLKESFARRPRSIQDILGSMKPESGSHE